MTNYNDAYTYADGKTSSEVSTYVGTYVATQKKGVPSLIVANRSNSRTRTSAAGTYFEQNNADGSWIENDNGTVSSGKSEHIWNDYAMFNGKGLVIETGEIRVDTKTGVQTVFPSRRIDYVMKKGKVAQAVVYSLDTTENNGVVTVTKQEATTMYQFKYAKAKANKVRYLSMINSFVGTAGGGAFTWF